MGGVGHGSNGTGPTSPNGAGSAHDAERLRPIRLDMMRTTLSAVTVSGLLLLAGCNAPNQGSLGDLATRGNTAFQGGQWEDALGWYNKYIERNPGDPDLRAQRGRTLLKLGRAYEAAADLRIASSQRTDRAEYLDSLCEALLASNERDELFRTLRTNAQDRGSVADHLRLGRFALAMGDGDTAKSALQIAVRIDRGQTVEPQLAFADFHRQIGDTAAAERRVRMAYYISTESPAMKTMARQLGLTPYPGWGIVPEETPSR